jgi:uncharacterized protein (DUF1810 family)
MPDRTDTLERFREAQQAPRAGFDDALREIRAGGKRTHWIWYVFPQISGLGRSGMSALYAIRDPEEAEAYLRDPVLGSRLVTIVEAVRTGLRAGTSLEGLMGSEIDAMKVVSSMTLFGEIARRLPPGSIPTADTIVTLAEEILAIASREGLPECRITRDRLGR